MNATFLAGLDFNSPSWDLFIYLFFLAAAFVYGFTLGRSRIVLLIISTYMALSVIYAATLPGGFFASTGTQNLTVGASPFFIVQITAFVGAMLLIFFFLTGSALRRALNVDDVQGKWWQIILLSLAHAGLLIAAIMSFIPEIQRTSLLGTTQTLFASNKALFFWTLAPILMMMLVKDPEGDGGH